MSYIFTSKFTVTQRYESETLLHKAITSDWSFDHMQREAMSKNLSYRRINMQYDFRRAQSMERAATPESKERAAKWFEQIYDPHRKAKGWTSSQETEFRAEGKMGLLETLEEAEEYKEEEEEYQKWKKTMGL